MNATKCTTILSKLVAIGLAKRAISPWSLVVDLLISILKLNSWFANQSCNNFRDNNRDEL